MYIVIRVLDDPDQALAVSKIEGPELKLFLCSEVVRDLDFASQCRFAREAGYDGLEIAPFTLAENPADLTGASVSRLRSIAEAEGTEIGGLHWLLAAPAGLSITSEDPQSAQRTREFGTFLVKLCSDLGGKYLVHGSPAQRPLEAGREAEGRERAADYFAHAGAEAEKAGVRYIVEPLARRDTGLINSVDEAVALIGDIGCNALDTMIDCYAACNNGEEVTALLRKWVPKGAISHVHFNDPNRRGPGQGTLAFGPIIDLLRELGYTGTSAVEPFEYLPDGPACAARAIGYLRGLLESHR